MTKWLLFINIKLGAQHFWWYDLTAIFKTLYLSNMCPIFVGSLNNLRKRKPNPLVFLGLTGRLVLSSTSMIEVSIWVIRGSEFPAMTKWKFSVLYRWKSLGQSNVFWDEMNFKMIFLKKTKALVVWVPIVVHQPRMVTTEGGQ